MLAQGDVVENLCIAVTFNVAYNGRAQTMRASRDIVLKKKINGRPRYVRERERARERERERERRREREKERGERERHTHIP